MRRTAVRFRDNEHLLTCCRLTDKSAAEVALDFTVLQPKEEWGESVRLRCHRGQPDDADAIARGRRPLYDVLRCHLLVDWTGKFHHEGWLLESREQQGRRRRQHEQTPMARASFQRWDELVRQSPRCRRGRVGAVARWSWCGSGGARGINTCLAEEEKQRFLEGPTGVGEVDRERRLRRAEELLTDETREEERQMVDAEGEKRGCSLPAGKRQQRVGVDEFQQGLERSWPDLQSVEN
ncbi:hypothetical protein BHM03_00038688 [Ensete ventricosum]|nr:hypothetical protein BHM03_00038688 [Ensete ventricosum]